MTVYEERDEILRSMGFDSYADYLKSDLWKGIRSRVIKAGYGRCVRCSGTARQVHHKEYSHAILAGHDIKPLVAVCRDCHEYCEFIAPGIKSTLTEANLRLASPIVPIPTPSQMLKDRASWDRYKAREIRKAKEEAKKRRAKKREISRNEQVERLKVLPGHCKGCGQMARKCQEYCRRCTPPELEKKIREDKKSEEKRKREVAKQSVEKCPRCDNMGNAKGTKNPLSLCGRCLGKESIARSLEAKRLRAAAEAARLKELRDNFNPAYTVLMFRKKLRGQMVAARK